jgi:hypothetical protein
MNLQRSYDEILNELLTAHFNKCGLAAGPLITIIYTAVAAVAWGVCRLGVFISRQIIPTGETDGVWVDKHARMRGLVRQSDESTAALLERINQDVNYPLAGGNLKDFEVWAMSVSYVHAPGDPAEWTERPVWAIVRDGADARGPGSVTVIVVSDNADSGNEGIATAELLAAITTYINSVRPAGRSDFVVCGAAHLVVDVSIAIEADDYDVVKSVIEERLPAMISTSQPGNKLTMAAIGALAMDCGAQNVAITAPSADVQPDNGPLAYERVYPGTITIVEMA